MLITITPPRPEQLPYAALSFIPMTVDAAAEVVGWRYEPPYAIYSMAAGDEEFLADPENQYYQIRTPQGELVAFCCFGHEAQVPGGPYAVPALDIGLGLRPDLTSKGLGELLVLLIIAFAQRSFAPPLLRLTVAAFNMRAIHVYERAGFVFQAQFTALSGLVFLVMTRPATLPGAAG